MDAESRYRRVQDRVRTVNKRMVNPVTLRFAGRPGSPYGVVRHVGRQSGRTYDTPVVVRESGGRFVVPLPYGTDVDWYRNVRAADGCAVVWRGSAYRATSPRLVSPSVAASAFPDWQRRLVRTAGADWYLRLERAEQLPDVYRDVTATHPAGPLVAAVGLALLAAVLRRAARSRG